MSVDEQNTKQSNRPQAVQSSTSLTSGSAWYLGAPGTGKTSLAWSHLRDCISRDARPAIVIDSIGDARFATLPLSSDVRNVVESAWKRRQSCRYIPTSEDGSDLDAICKAAAAGGCVHLLIDESAFYLNSRRGVFSPLPRLLRSYRHSDVTIQLTTQHPSGDVSQEALACAPTLFVFRTQSPRALEMLEREYGVPSTVIGQLPYPTRDGNRLLCHFVAVSPGGSWELHEEALTF